MRAFGDLRENEILALAIAAEEEDGRIYADFAHGLGRDYPDSAGVFSGMAVEEDAHRRRLIALYQRKFGDHIPLIRRADVRGFHRRRPIWPSGGFSPEAVRRRAGEMEQDAARFYRAAAARASDADLRLLLGDLAREEERHEGRVFTLEHQHLGDGRREAEDQTGRRRLVVGVVQPGLVGLMDGSISTLAPVFAAAFASGRPHQAFLVGLAASAGAGISMGFAEALTDDGRLSGRGAPLLRGLACGLMTMLGGLGHTLPFLIRDFRVAVAVAIAAVLGELAAIVWIRARFMDTAPLPAALQVALGGGLVFGAGALIGAG